jgi:hypothetical protein
MTECCPFCHQPIGAMRFGVRAAASLPVGERDHFLQSVAAHLTGAPTDDAVIAAINAALDAAAVAWRA